MKIKLRLYRQHDLDLIGLYINPDFNFRNAVKHTLTAYVRNEPYTINFPEPVLPRKKINYLIQICVNLDESEGDIADWLVTMKSGYRNSMIKNILRGYMPVPNIYLYNEDIDIRTPDTNAKTAYVDKKSGIKHTDRISVYPPLDMAVCKNKKKSTALTRKMEKRTEQPANKSTKINIREPKNDTTDIPLEKGADDIDLIDMFEGIMDTM